MEQSFKRLSPLFNYSTALYHNGEYLLIIDRAFNMESYRRIYFKDIQSLQIQKTNTWLMSAVVMGVMAGIFTLFGVALWLSADANDDGLRVLAAIMFALAIVFGAVMGRTLILGKTCKVYACTAVQRIYLPNVGTLRKLESFTELIRPFIDDAQGTFADNELSDKLAELWKTMRKERKGSKRLKPKTPGKSPNEAVEVTPGESATEATEQADSPTEPSPQDVMETEESAEPHQQSETEPTESSDQNPMSDSAETADRTPEITDGEPDVLSS